MKYCSFPTLFLAAVCPRRLKRTLPKQRDCLCRCPKSRPTHVRTLAQRQSHTHMLKNLISIASKCLLKQLFSVNTVQLRHLVSDLSKLWLNHQNLLRLSANRKYNSEWMPSLPAPTAGLLIQVLWKSPAMGSSGSTAGSWVGTAWV